MRLSILVIGFLLVTSPLWGKIVFHSGRNGRLEIYSMKSDGTGQTRLTHFEAPAGRDSQPTWSPNGRQIAFTRDVFIKASDWQDLEIFVMEADGSNQRNLTQHPEMDNSPDWSPDGSQIAFTSGRGKGLSIFVMEADGTNIRQLTEGPFEVRPKWSPDGKRIAYAGMVVPGAGRQIYMMNADGTNHWQVSEPIPRAGMFLTGGWSPDGTQIMYKASIHALVTHASVFIATLNAAKSRVVKRERVPIPKMDSSTTAWGADGKSILISLRKAGEKWDIKEGGKWDIYRFSLLDRQLTQLTDHPASDLAPDEWNPRLSVSPRGLVPKRWGEIKSHSHRNRGSGGILPPPIP